MKRIILLSMSLVMLLTSHVRAEEDFARQRNNMVENQIKARGITDPNVLEAMRTIKRHLFVPKRKQRLAYQDTALPIGMEQTISQPYIVALMTEAAQLKPEDKVLEIGTGSGYQAAVLADIVKDVYTIEIVKPLGVRAKKILESLDYSNIHLKIGDGYEGWQEHAPYDAILVTAAPEKVPEKLLEQLAVGGRMVIPLGKRPRQDLRVFIKTEEGYFQKFLLPVRFVPMVAGDQIQKPHRPINVFFE